MRPLQAIAMGLVIQLLVAPVGGFDVLADPLGWVLVVVGLRDLPEDVELRGAALLLAVVAFVVSLPLWVPAVTDALEDADESLAWVANLPHYGCYLLIALALAKAAEAAGERTARAWWSAMVLGCALVVGLPVLIFGGGQDDLEGVAGVLVAAVPLLIVVLLFWYSGRTWAGAPPPASGGDAAGAPPRTR